MKRLKRGFIILILFLGLVFSVVLTFKSYYIGEWNTIAGGLAVISAIMATFLSLKVIWKEEDEFEPAIIIFFDTDSRSGVTQLVIKNVGGSNAYDIKIEWNRRLFDAKNKEVNLPYVPVLAKGESIRLIVDSTRKMFNDSKKNKTNLCYDGFVKFKYSKKSKKYTNESFEICLEQFKYKIKPVSDKQVFHLQNANLNESIQEINKTLKDISVKLDKEL